jgi:hypothetical protein
MKKLLIALLIGILLYVPYVPIGFWVAPPTGSMQPEIMGCDINIYGPGIPSVGDIMFYWNSDMTLISHRIVDTNTQGYVFKGDNMDEADGTVPLKDIHSEIYANIDTNVKRKHCIEVMRTPFNLYYNLVGSDKDLEYFAVEPVN